jgi:hypothetical protein
MKGGWGGSWLLKFNSVLLSETASGFVVICVNLKAFAADFLPHFKREPASLAAIAKALIGGLLF